MTRVAGSRLTPCNTRTQVVSIRKVPFSAPVPPRRDQSSGFLVRRPLTGSGYMDRTWFHDPAMLTGRGEGRPMYASAQTLDFRHLSVRRWAIWKWRDAKSYAPPFGAALGNPEMAGRQNCTRPSEKCLLSELETLSISCGVCGWIPGNKIAWRRGQRDKIPSLTVILTFTASIRPACLLYRNAHDHRPRVLGIAQVADAMKRVRQAWNLRDTDCL